MKNLTQNIGPLPIRIMFGIAFIYYGIPKLFDPQTHEFITGMLTQIGVPAPDFMTYVVGAVETLGGLSLIVGVFTPFASAALIPVMLVALFNVHISQGFSFMHIISMTEAGPQFGVPGYEVNLIYIAGLFTLILVGAGKYSLDNIITLRLARTKSAQ
ncbi:MAG: DoxX family protein [candidate division Zixibacteria bacterium]|nr:DoxX family protein [candidate division Zixibacteria bacterium]